MKKVITVVLLTVAICAVNSMSEVVANEVEVIASGNRGKVDESSDGSNLTWTLDSKGALTISENKEETMSQIPEGYARLSLESDANKERGTIENQMKPVSSYRHCRM